jgi:transcriptional regulator with XRE-family HTH domain
MSNLQDRLIAIRKQENLTQAELAEKIGTSRNTVSSIERTGMVSTDVADKICQRFTLSKEWLMTGNGVAPVGFITSNAAENNPWETALVKQLKAENENLLGMIEFLKGLIVNPSKENFLKLLNYTGTPKMGKKAHLGVQLRSDLRKAA